MIQDDIKDPSYVLSSAFRKDKLYFGFHKIENQAFLGIYNTKTEAFSFQSFESPEAKSILMIHKLLGSEVNDDEVFMFISKSKVLKPSNFDINYPDTSESYFRVVKNDEISEEHYIFSD